MLRNLDQVAGRLICITDIDSKDYRFVFVDIASVLYFEFIDISCTQKLVEVFKLFRF